MIARGPPGTAAYNTLLSFTAKAFPNCSNTSPVCPSFVILNTTRGQGGPSPELVLKTCALGWRIRQTRRRSSRGTLSPPLVAGRAACSSSFVKWHRHQIFPCGPWNAQFVHAVCAHLGNWHLHIGSCPSQQSQMPSRTREADIVLGTDLLFLQ